MTRRFGPPVLAIVAATAFIAATGRISQTRASRAHLVIVVDGLRPDYVTPALMPRLTRLGGRGIVFNAHHSSFPTVTRVNASSMATGAYPESHGVLGNSVYFPSVNPTRGIDTGSREVLEKIAGAEGRLLTAPSLGEILQQAGRRMLVVGSGSSGAAFLLNHAVPGGAMIHHEFTRPAELSPRVLETLGPPPPHALPNVAQNRRAVDAYLKIGLRELRPDVTFMWISDPDTTAHTHGVATATTRNALAAVDVEIGRIEDALAEQGVLDRTNVIVVSDHGFSTHGGAFRLSAAVEPFVRKLPDGTPDLVVAEGAIYFRGGPDSDRLSAIVRALQKEPDVGAIFTAPPQRGEMTGVVPGTLSFDAVRWTHARSGAILVSANWSDATNDAGYKGKTTDAGGAGHGSSSPYDIHNTLIAAGPDFREHAASGVPTGNVDLAPTLLRLLGMTPPPTMTGRVIEEGLRGGPEPASMAVERTTRTVTSSDGAYALTAHFSTAAGRRYLDFTEVTRR